MKRLALCLALALIASPADARRRKKAKKPPVTKTEPKVQPTIKDGKQKIAILQLGSLGISSAMMKNLEMLLQRSIETIDTVTAIPAIDIQVALQNPKHKAIAECGGGPSCAVKVGKLVGADAVVFGTIGAIGQNFSLNLRVLDVAAGRELARQQASISGNRDLLIPEMRLAAYRLIAPDRIVGSLLIEIDVEGVAIEIDGKLVGTTPLKKPVENLSPGAHVVVLKRPGYSQFQQEFKVKPFETARLKLELKKAQK